MRLDTQEGAKTCRRMKMRDGNTDGKRSGGPVKDNVVRGTHLSDKCKLLHLIANVSSMPLVLPGMMLVLTCECLLCLTFWRSSDN